MRLLLVHNILNDSTSVSGVLREYVNMAREWRELGHTVDFLVARAAFPQLQRLAPGVRLVCSDSFFNATGHLDQAWRYLPAYAWRCVTSHFTRLPERYDLVYATGPFPAEIYPARVIARRLGAKLVVKVQHVLGAQTQRVGLLNRLNLWGERLSAGWVNRWADALFCLSAPVAEDYRRLEERFGLHPLHPAVVGCGLDLERFQTLPEEQKEFDVVFLGRMHALKGVFDLPHVWQEVVRQRPGTRLVVIGEGPHRARMEAMFRELGLQDSVTCTGGITEERKNELLARARVGLSLSSEEGWGLAVNECLASGLPVVAYDLPVFRHVFPDLLDTVPLGDRMGVAARLVALLGDAKRRGAQGGLGRAYVQRYDHRTVARQELALLEAVVHGKHSLR